MSKRDYYEILEISKDSTDQTIKKAYKKMAMKYHPDRNPNDNTAEEKFKEVKEAYEVLIDPNKRNAYDQYGHSAFDQHSGAGGFGAGFSGFGDIFGDIFGDMFGGGQAGQRVVHGEDLRYDLNLSLEEAVKGCSKEITIPTYVKCDPCKATGAQEGSNVVKCVTCQGRGRIRIQQGFFMTEQGCHHCNGSGQKIEKPCNQCRGKGRIHKQRNMMVKIPAGIDSGNQLRLNGEGAVGENGAPAGDLYVVVNILQHDIFEREGVNLYCDIPISYTTAALGGSLEIPTLEGKVKLTIPKETQTGKLFRIRGKGVKSIRSAQIGDLICKIYVETPVNLNTEQKELLEKFEESLNKGEKHKPKSSNFFTKIKNFVENITK